MSYFNKERNHAPKSKKKFKMPHIYVILFIFGVIATLATYIVPSGEFKRIKGPEGREMVDADSFHYITSAPVSIVDFISIIPRGLIEAGEIVFFTLIIGGMFMVLRRTGIIEIAVDNLARRFIYKSIFIIPVLTTVFAIVATLIGTAELSLVYIPVIIPLIIALGYDSITATAIALCGTVVGFTVGVLNPINTGLAQKLSGIPVFSGIGLRIVLFIVVLAITIIFIMRYARKIQKQPTLSSVYEDDSEKRELYQHITEHAPSKATTRQKWGIAVIFAFLIILVYGVTTQGWFMIEMAGLFIFMGVIVGYVSGLSMQTICEAFNDGFKDVLMGAIIVGLARSIAVVLEDGKIMDTIVHGLGSAIDGTTPTIAVIGMYAVQMLINFIISSGSGQALVTMPIMAPLSDMLGITRQTAVLAFQLGDGFTHIFYPTSGYFMAALAIGGVSYTKWIRFFFPLFIIWAIISIITLMIAQLSGWS
ncbi:YfcC family protein [Staphylococcus pseudoxylosus]|uniref:YfcC family protein n=1 Tax=Staphylococcus pseudoxylosus TaxID=2282419 RepID=UPI000D1F418D|nr:Na+/H+ antiporter NhaC family protein [Staphylococcus pseudoxylosus]PTI59036.1 C4-dicarboxylate ABC transporter [Staphylococcus xylosus]MDW8797305.1 Na+/H+ antiporter NhaC family protein [Staphylococcus pseudoxylosus]MEB6036335.1 YfcC family protein [Staphylococcus pseudoxylosus]MEB6044583.1 YfcC family protein [Staphylococcus pseudoxylosus]MEB6061095.1 YfcC family protein [Staphylococcus pseudoxylosus]